MLKTFLVEHCQFAHDARIAKAEFYEAYCHWEQNHGRKPVPINEIGRQMKELGFGEARTKNNRFWNGIRLIGLDAVAALEIEKTPSTPPISLNGSTRDSSALEEAINERLRQDLHGGWTYQQL